MAEGLGTRWSDWLGVFVGLLLAGAFGVVSLLGISKAVNLGGTLGKLSDVVRRYVPHDKKGNTGNDEVG